MQPNPTVDISIEHACEVILGEAVAHAIICDRGVHWAVVAAMTECTTAPKHRSAKAAIDRWLAAQKQRRGM